MKQKTIKRKIYIAFLASLFTVVVAFDQTQAAKTWIDPDLAVKEDPDFLIQGEYGSNKPGTAYGVQVVALGGGNFDAYILEDGLPGVGWTRKKGRTMIKGSRNGDKIIFSPVSLKFKSCNYKMSGIIKEGIFHLTAKDVNEISMTIMLPRIQRKSPTLGVKPPKGALVLFDGSSAEHWKNGKVENGYLKATGCTSKQHYADYSLHLEFRTPYMPTARGQHRGNSGIYHSGRWETQILDSFGLEGKDNQAGGIYSISKPHLNMCLPPLAWQTYDVDFTAAKFDANGKRTKWARIIVRLNGVLVQNDTKHADGLELNKNYTTAAPIRSPLKNPMGPIYLQDHTNPVVYRNIWVTTPTPKKSVSRKFGCSP